MYLMALLLSIELTMGLATVNVIAKEQFITTKENTPGSIKITWG